MTGSLVGLLEPAPAALDVLFVHDEGRRVGELGQEVGLPFRHHRPPGRQRRPRADAEKRLTYFELLTSVAFQWFGECRVDAVVLETGLGGRLDATNIIERPLAAVITSVAMDHRQFLGGTLKAIATEKAGIIKPGCPVFCARLEGAALEVVRQRAKALGAALTVCPGPWKQVGANWGRNEQALESPSGDRYILHLLGSGQAANAALARAVLDGLFGVLPVEETAWEEGLKRVSWPGRFEVLALNRRRLILDGAHNEEAMTALARTWARTPWSRRKALWMIGVMKDKDVNGLLRPLAPLLRDVVAVRPDNPRALDPRVLAERVRVLCPRAQVQVEPDVKVAIANWLKSRKGEVGVVCGSFYLAGQALQTIHE